MCYCFESVLKVCVIFSHTELTPAPALVAMSLIYSNEKHTHSIIIRCVIMPKYENVPLKSYTGQ